MSFFHRYLTTIFGMLVVAVAVRFFLNFPAWLTLAGLIVAWPFIGTLVTADDDFPGGWSNPDGRAVPEWKRLWWWADLLLVRGGVVLLLFAAEQVFAGQFSVFPFVVAVAMIGVGLPIFLRGVRRESAHAV